MEQETVLSFEGVSFGYKGLSVLDNVDLEVQRGEFVALLGANDISSSGRRSAQAGFRGG